MSVQRTDRNGRSRTMCLLLRQKVGGSSPSERAQVRGTLPDPEEAFPLLARATLGATCACPYTSLVMAMLACPRISETTCSGVP